MMGSRPSQLFRLPPLAALEGSYHSSGAALEQKIEVILSQSPQSRRWSFPLMNSCLDSPNAVDGPYIRFPGPGSSPDYSAMVPVTHRLMGRHFGQPIVDPVLQPFNPSTSNIFAPTDRPVSRGRRRRRWGSPNPAPNNIGLSFQPDGYIPAAKGRRQCFRTR